MSDLESLGFDKAHLVGVYHQDQCPELGELQLPLHIDESLILVVQFEDHIYKQCSGKEATGNEYNIFLKKYSTLNKEELLSACSIPERDFYTCLSKLVSCVGCRRSVETLFQQFQKFEHPVYKCLSVSSNGCLRIAQNFVNNPKKLFHLLHYVRSKLFDCLENVMNSKKNKRCLFHSLKMLKPNENQSENKLVNSPKPWNCSVIDVWDRMCQECQKEVATLECHGVMETMEYYLKKHRFCSECKSKVLRAFHMLTGDVDYSDEPRFCSAIFEGLKVCCKHQPDKENRKSNHDCTNGISKSPQYVHVCCERGYIMHMLTQADAELAGGRKERHAKTIDIAQEEVCTCLSLCLYNRLHRVWLYKLTLEQTWFTLFYLGVELVHQSFEMCIEKKIGIGRMEALCLELEHDEKLKESKIQKKRLKRKRQKKKKEQLKIENEKHEIIETAEHHCLHETVDEPSQCKEYSFQQTVSFCHHNSGNDVESGKFHSSLLDMLNGQPEMEHHCNEENEDDSMDELSKAEILEFERNKLKIIAERTRLRERIKQNFENFVVAANVAEQ